MKRRRTSWPRWAKITRNLFLFIIFALIIWTQLDKPLPYNAELRRTARQYLLPKMEHSAEISRGYWGGSLRIDWTEGAAMLSIPARTSGAFYIPITEPYHLQEGTNLLASPWSTLLPTEAPGGMAVYAIYIALYPPEEGETAVLTLHNNAGTFTAEAKKEGSIFVFRIKPEPDEDGGTHMDSSWYILEEYTYELQFYDSGGTEICRVSG